MNRSYKGDLWIVIKPAEDVPGVWVSHCLTLDVMSQGASPRDALKHLMGAVFMAVADDLFAGRDPAERGKKTPAEDWEEHARILREGQRVSLHDDQSEKRSGPLATNIGFQLTLNIETKTSSRSKRSARASKTTTDESLPPMMVVEQTPPAWMLPAPSSRTAHR